MAFFDFLFGKKQQDVQRPIYSPHQEQLLSQILGQAQALDPMGLQFLQNLLGGNPEDLQAFEAPAMRQFQEDILPSIAERFTQFAGEGGQRSSAFGQSLGKAGASLAENLAAQRASLGFSALGNLQSLLGAALRPTQEYIPRPGRSGGILNLLGLLSPGIQNSLTNRGV